MRKMAAAAVAIILTLNLYAQGTVNFANNSSTPVYLDYIGGPLVPAGSTYSVGLYYAPDGYTDESMFIMLGAATGFTVQAPSGGIFLGGTRTASTITPGGFGMFQVRGWTSAYGTSYEAALYAGGTYLPGAVPNRVGKSSIIRVDTGNPLSTPAGTPTSLVASGLQSFVLWIPEPDATVLGFFGGGMLIVCAFFNSKRRTVKT
jgi:hypothetical protein